MDRLTAEQALAALSFLSFQSSEGEDGPNQLETPQEDQPTPASDTEIDLDYQRQLQALIPDWIPEEEEDEKEIDTASDSVSHNPTPSSAHLSWLERCPPDVSALVLSHLDLPELAHVSLVSRTLHQACRTDALWRRKFLSRWNFVPSQNYYQAYQQAYGHVHDLWVTHDNCVPPDDGDAPGRCCIPSPQSPSYTRNLTTDNEWNKYCPTCRYAPLSKERLPRLVQQALETERSFQQPQNNVKDPVQETEVEAAAHALLLKEQNVEMTSPSNAIFATTRYAIAKWCRRHLPLERFLCRPLHTRRVACARRAFAAAATFYRTLSTQQYEADALHFLTDVLFFNVGTSPSSLTQEAVEESEQLRKDVYGEENDRQPRGSTHSVAALDPIVEISHHSWHMIQLTNPDFVRPLTFRIFIQRADCFTAFPSEGYLEPGQTCQVCLGVRNLGTVLCRAFEALNVQREEVDPFWAEVYTTEAHLPYAPFAIRYMFCPTEPCIPPSFTSRGGVQQAPSLRPAATAQAAASKTKDVVSYLWEHVATEACVRTLYLSAHVHSHYTLDDFVRDTLQPFDIRVNRADSWGPKPWHTVVDPPVYVGPNLLHKDAKLFDRISNLRLEVELSDAGEAARTEKGCLGCGRDWGQRSEQLGRSHLLQTLISAVHESQQHVQLHNLVLILRHVYTCVYRKSQQDDSLDMDRASEILYVLHSTLLEKRAHPLMSSTHQRLLLRLESVIDELYDVIQIRIVESELPAIAAAERGRGWEPWRNVGVYPYVTCSDSIFGKKVDIEIPAEVDLPLTPIVKDELDYLDAFRYLCHSPGLYSLGQQQDPNHTDVIAPADNRFYGLSYDQDRPRGSDIFMDSNALALATALALIHDPRSLIVHGMYHLVPPPGTISRRPALTNDLFLRQNDRDEPDLMERASVLVKMWKRCRLEKYPRPKLPSLPPRFGCQSTCLLSTDLDHDSHALLHVMARPQMECYLLRHSSFRHFIRNIPPPGVGQFSLRDLQDELNTDVASQLVPARAFIESLQDGATENITADDIESAETVNEEEPPVGADNVNQNGFNPLAGLQGRGPRVIRLLWLLSAQFGWAVDESYGAGSVIVDRRILIASQWVSNSLMVLPLLYTLLARYVQWIASKPIDYHLDGLPFHLETEMRYLTAREAGSVSILVLLLWLKMGRYAERRICRSLERSMRDHLSPPVSSSSVGKQGIISKIIASCVLAFQRVWDLSCPLFLQRRVFTPRWNRRSDTDVMKHFASWRSRDLREHRSVFQAKGGRGVPSYGACKENGGLPVGLGEESSAYKFVTGLLVSLGSFLASSPHFLLNVMTVFSCSLALGMSVSLQSVEMGRGTTNSSNPKSLIEHFSLNTVILFFVLVGQLVGSSGGLLFLAEFVVTTVSLALGGAGTISASAMESWGCFFCLSSTAFWGYLFARVGIADGIRHKRRGPSLVVLCTCLVVLWGLWFFTLGLIKWDLPPSLMLVSPVADPRIDRTTIKRRLQ